MITISTDKLKAGMITCQSIYDSTGLFLLRRGTKLTSFYIRKIIEADIKEIAVLSTNIYKNIELPDDVVCETTRSNAIKNLSTTFDALEEKGVLILDKMQSSIISIIKDLIHNKSNLVQINDICTYDNYTLIHSVNVAVLSSLIGVIYNLSPKDLEELTLGAMLHDIGKIFIPIEILNKPTTLSNDEFDNIKKHPVYSMQKLREACSFSQNIIEIASQHHERIDGKGYPYNLASNDINFFAKIVAIADVYDALTSIRPYKKAYKPHIAYTIMMFHSEGQFDVNILKKFFAHVALYPNGTIVKTNLGAAIVKESLQGQVTNPIIFIFTDKHHQLLSNPLLVDLAKNSNCYIESVLDDNEILFLIEQLHFDPVSLLDTGIH